jgi:hypothetical protein
MQEILTDSIEKVYSDGAYNIFENQEFAEANNIEF